MATTNPPKRRLLLIASCLLLLFVSNPTAVLRAAARKFITYGSGINLIHSLTSNRLFSAKIAWGSGSGQQVVTAMPDDHSSSLLWYVKEGHGLNFRSSGVAVRCGDVIRLEHINSEKHLHSHDYRSPISGQHEVSGYGGDEEGISDSGDNFQVECAKENSKGFWAQGEDIRLKHVLLEGFLSSQKQKKFTRDNCPRCPILGHLEVVVTKSATPTADSIWKVLDGMMLSKEDGDDDDESAVHDEL